MLFSDRKEKVIGAAHSGWKGALTGVLEATIQAMGALGAKNITASIGPAIGGGSYEVGAEFKERFMEESVNNEQFFVPAVQGAARSGGVLEAKTSIKYFFNITAYVKNRLTAAGVGHIGHVNHDTLLDEKRFFSYRRACLAGETSYGRQVSVIMLEQ